MDFPINSMVDLSIVFCKRLPEGNDMIIDLDDGKNFNRFKPNQFDGKNPWVSGVEFSPTNQSNDMLNGDFPIKNGDFPIKNGDFPWLC